VLPLLPEHSNSSAVAKSTRRMYGEIKLPCVIPSTGIPSTGFVSIIPSKGGMDTEVLEPVTGVVSIGVSIGVSLGISLLECRIRIQ